MALPTPPDYTSPIPNNPFYSLLEWYIPGPYSPLVVGAGLNIDPDGVISATGGGGVSSLIAGPGLSVNSSTGNVTITNTGVTSLVAGTGINVSAASGTVTIDATTFGTVTGITTGAGLTGGPITVTGTIALAPSGATAGIYTSPTITIDTYGRILTATSNTVVNAINVTAPLTIAGTTNPTLGVGAGTTATAGVVQLSDAVNDTSSTCAASTAAVALAYTAATQAIPKTCITGKGALVTGSAASTPVAIPAGADGQVLYACSGSATGLCWSSVPAVAQATPTTLGTLKGCTIGDGLLTSMTALGCNTLRQASGALNNVGVGFGTLCSLSAGGFNTGIGDNAGRLLTGSCNTLMGFNALRVATSAICNVALGNYSGNSLTTGGSNVFLGYCAGNNITTGCCNVVIGPDAQPAANGDCQLAIGFSATDNWLTGNSTKAIKPGAGIIDCANTCGTANQVLVSTGANAIEWKSVNSALAAPNYGSYLGVASQTPTGGVTTGIPVLIDTILGQNGFSVVAGSQITAANAGLYNLQFSIQIISTGGGGGSVEIWLAKNGTAVANSNTIFKIQNANEAEFAALNYVEPLTAGQYLELYWATDNANMELHFANSTMGGPDIPAVILTIVPVGA